MSRLLSFWAFFMCTVYLNAQEIQIFERGYRFGVFGPDSTELIPPVYDHVGWSKGSPEPVGNLIGYFENGKWGVISLQNKPITQPIFYQVSKFGPNLILCSIKGRFSNQLFYGVIDNTGITQISCNYFSIEQLPSNQFKVGIYKNGEVKYGLISKEFELSIPPAYEEIIQINDHLIGLRTPDYYWKFYSLFGSSTLDMPLIDHYEPLGDNIIIERKGAKGLISAMGEVVRDPVYKDIQINSPISTLEFPEWDIRDKNLETIATIQADSIQVKYNLLSYYQNGTQQLLDKIPDLEKRNTQIISSDAEHVISRSMDQNKYSVHKTSGTLLLGNKDSIHFTGTYFIVKDGDRWTLYNRYGSLISKRNYEGFDEEIHTMIPAKLNRYWGLIDFQGQLQVRHKFDQIKTGPNNRFIVKYLESWGVIDAFGNWVIKPDYVSIDLFGNSLICQSDKGFELFDKRGEKLTSLSQQIAQHDGYLELIGDDNKKGIVTQNGTYITYPIYDEIGKIGDYYFGKINNSAVAWDKEGKEIIDMNKGVEDILAFSEGYFLIKKDGKYGFVDGMGNLRIANRYDLAFPLSGGMAAIKLRGKWGFIDKQETLRVQPRYDSVSSFSADIAIVKKGNDYGLIDKNGMAVIKPNYAEINITSGNSFVLVDENGFKGLVSKQGQILLQANYNDITDIGEGKLIVDRRGDKGLMDVDGFILLDFNYQEIKSTNNYFFLMKNL